MCSSEIRYLPTWRAFQHGSLGHAGKVPGTREWVVRGLPYIIVYLPNPDLDELTVLAVFHGARDR